MSSATSLHDQSIKKRKEKRKKKIKVILLETKKQTKQFYPEVEFKVFTYKVDFFGPCLATHVNARKF